MESASHFLQLGKESVRKFEAPGALPYGELPHTLSFTRYVHGEIRCSIYPSHVGKKPARARTVAASQVRKALAATDAEVGHARDERAWQQKNLVQCSEFQDDTREISGYGGLPKQKMFRRYARRMIQEWGEIAWRKFGQSGIFLTGTVPGSGAVIAETVARFSGWLMNRVRQWFRDSFSQDYAVSAVWELQQRGMLHIHLCVCSMEKEVLDSFLTQWRQKWTDLLIELSEETGVDLFRKDDHWTWRNDLAKTRQDAQWLIQNPARYLAKYLSKGSREDASKSVFHPSRWWSVDRKTASEARAERMRVMLGGRSLQELARFMADWFKDAEDNFEALYPFKNPNFPGCGGVVAFAETKDSAVLVDYFELKTLTQFDFLVRERAA